MVELTSLSKESYWKNELTTEQTSLPTIGEADLKKKKSCEAIGGQGFLTSKRKNSTNGFKNRTGPAGPTGWSGDRCLIRFDF